MMIKDQTDLSHPQTLVRNTSTRDGEPLKSCVSRCQSMENRLACLFFFLAILYDDGGGSEQQSQSNIWPGQTKKQSISHQLPRVQLMLFVFVWSSGPIILEIGRVSVSARRKQHAACQIQGIPISPYKS